MKEKLVRFYKRRREKTPSRTGVPIKKYVIYLAEFSRIADCIAASCLSTLARAEPALPGCAAAGSSGSLLGDGAQEREVCRLPNPEDS